MCRLTHSSTCILRASWLLRRTASGPRAIARQHARGQLHLQQRRTSITYPGGSDEVEYEYDEANNLTSVTDWNGKETTYASTTPAC
jgi:YD repeat-containing protein